MADGPNKDDVPEFDPPLDRDEWIEHWRMLLAKDLEAHKVDLATNLEKYRATNEASLADWKYRSEVHLRAAITGHESVMQFAIAALRGTLLTNGGAAIALLAFLGHIWASSDNVARQAAVGLTDALWFFIVGAGLSASATCLGYLTQVFFVEVTKIDHSGIRWPAEMFRAIAALLVGASIVLFFVGTDAAVSAFKEGSSILLELPTSLDNH